MKHLFDVEIAKLYGMDVAVFLENLCFWIIKNQANKENLHDGRYWTYNTLEAFTIIFPYLTKKQVRRIIEKCAKEDLIVRGNYNQIGYDRTIWYSLSDKGHALFGIDVCPNGKIDVPKRADRNDQNGTPIPYINTDNKPYIKDKSTQPKNQVALVDLPPWLSLEIWEDFVQHRKDIKKPMTPLAKKKMILKLEHLKESGQDIVEVINTSIANGWQGVFEIKQFKENSHGKCNVIYGKNGAECANKSWSQVQMEILKRGCGLQGDADLTKIEGIIPGEIQWNLQNGGGFNDCRPSFEDYVDQYSGRYSE